jgi:FkbM family methyltransferase
MLSRTVIVKSIYSLTRKLLPIRLRNHIKQQIIKGVAGQRLLEKLAHENFLTQSSTTIKIHGYEILIPERHHLKAIMEREPLRENLLAQASKVLLQRENDKFIDIGANIGDTAAVVYGNAGKHPHSILIEPSEFFFSFLEKNQAKFPNSMLMKNFVAHEYPIQELQGTLHHWGGTAKFIEGSNNEEHAPQIDLVDLLDENVKLVKIDCDGMDFKILKSVIPRIGIFSPAFYFENEITSLEQYQESAEVLKLFKNQGYKYAIASRNCGTLIFGGEIGTSLDDILQLQYALHNQGLRNAIYYTDILIFHDKQETDFLRTLELMRESQKLLIQGQLGSR